MTKCLDQPPHSPHGVKAGKTCLDNNIGTAPLLRIGHLSRNHGSGFGRRHSPSRADPIFLHIARCGGDHHHIHPPFTTGFEQQRDIKHCGPGAGRPGPR
jgi:hypothetical protein